MILPTTYALTMILTVLSMICWGSWASTYKLAKKWRFELYYFDFSFGVLLTAVVAAFTLGSLGDDLSFLDNLLIAGRHQMVYAIAAGVIFNLGNMLLLAAVSLTGMSVAFPVGMGVALVVGALWAFLLNPAGSSFLTFSGIALVIAAIGAGLFAYRAYAEEDGEITEDFNIKGIIISLVSGLILGSIFPLIERSRIADVGLGPYSVAFFFAIGAFLTTFIYNLYFMNLPVEGEPVGFGQYIREGSFSSHFLGVLGGIVWCTGMVASLVASASTAPIGPAPAYGIIQGAAVLAALWGIFAWKEYAGAETRVKLSLLLMIVLYAAGVGLVAIAPIYLK